MVITAAERVVGVERCIIFGGRLNPIQDHPRFDAARVESPECGDVDVGVATVEIDRRPEVLVEALHPEPDKPHAGTVVAVAGRIEGGRIAKLH